MVGYQIVELKPGQFVFGRKTAAIELGMSEQSTRTCLQHLKDFKNIAIKTTNKFSIISIINWDRYQQTESQINQQVTNKQPASNQQVTTNKNVKECKNVKKKENPLPPIPDFIDPELWEQYILIRKKKKASDTPYAIKLIINKLTKYHAEGFDPNESLRDSIEGSWKSVYQPKNNRSGRREPNQPLTQTILDSQQPIEDLVS